MFDVYTYLYINTHLHITPTNIRLSLSINDKHPGKKGGKGAKAHLLASVSEGENLVVYEALSN
jgi:hypothetical protein